MKRDFVTGLSIFVPIILTVLIIIFIVNILTAPFLESIECFLSHIFHLSKGKDSPVMLELVSKMMILFLLFAFTLFLGFFCRHFLIDYFLQVTNRLLLKVPVFNKIYRASQEVVESLFSSKSRTFSHVVFVPFPTEQNYSVGFVSTENVKIEHFKEDGEWVSVFVPETPNVSGGYLLLMRKNALIYSTLKVDEALKFVVSCGLSLPEFKTYEKYSNSR